MWSTLIGCPGRTRCGMRSESCRLCKPPRSLSLLIDLPRRRDSDGEPRPWRARRQGCCDAYLCMLSGAPIIGAEAALNVADFLDADIGADGADILRGVATMHGEVSAKRSGLRPSDVVTVLAPRGLCPPRPPRHDVISFPNVNSCMMGKMQVLHVSTIFYRVVQKLHLTSFRKSLLTVGI